MSGRGQMSRFTPRQSVKANRRVEDVVLRNKVTELQAEVSILKNRLAELRKAKNNVVVRREREIVTVTSLPRTSGSSRLEKSAMSPQRERHSRQQLPKLDSDICDRVISRNEIEHLKETIADLTQSLSELNVKNCRLQDENRLLSVKVQELAEELSVKEAEWCAKEEKMKLEVLNSRDNKLNSVCPCVCVCVCISHRNFPNILLSLQLQMNWGDRYHEWMRQTELKIEELQQANFLLYVE
jgi:regulator of replication initiation timing